MAQRKDGIEKKNRLLTAACRVFAEKGFRDAKISDICKLAGANVAAVNYYFGDKEALYRTVWRHTFEYCGNNLLPELRPEDPEKSLKNYIRKLIRNLLPNTEFYFFSRLYLMELAHPTGLVRDLWREMIKPKREKLLQVIRALIGEDSDQEKVVFCEISLISQCKSLLTIDTDDLEYLLGKPFDSKTLDRFVDHVFRFSLAGMRG